MVAENRIPNPFSKRRPQPASVTDALNREPPKMSLTNVVDPRDTIFPQFNPEQIRETLKSQWERITIPGLSHQRLNYISSDNHGFRFKLQYDGTGRDEDTRLLHEDHRRWIQAHFHPRGGADSILGGSAPRLLFIWPNLISMTAIIDSADFTLKRFTSELKLIAWEVSLTLAEIRDVRLTFEEVRAQGTQRRGSPTGASETLEGQFGTTGGIIA